MGSVANILGQFEESWQEHDQGIFHIKNVFS